MPWCGCFVNACIMAGGLPSGAGWIGYTPSILERAKSGTAGWTFQKEGVPGDLALYDNGAGGDPVVHVEIVRKRLTTTSLLDVSAATRAPATAARTTAAWSPAATTARPSGSSASSGSPARRGSADGVTSEGPARVGCGRGTTDDDTPGDSPTSRRRCPGAGG